MTETTEERHGLLKFVPPNFSSDAAALVVESEEFLEELRELMPAARIAFLTTEHEKKIFELCQKLKVDILKGDYTREGLPTEPKIFDVILAKDCLTLAPDFYVTLLELNHLLKDSGFLVTQFLNVRFIGLLEGLRRGEFPMHEKRFWAKWDVVKLLDDAIYKEIRFLPEKKLDESKAPEVRKWVEFGFDNFNEDLLTKIWIVKARKCEAEVAALKEIYTEEIRARLSRLIHRIEYDIDREENLRKLSEFCAEKKIFEDYLEDFVAQVTVHPETAELIRKFQFGAEFV